MIHCFLISHDITYNFYIKTDHSHIWLSEQLNGSSHTYRYEISPIFEKLIRSVQNPRFLPDWELYTAKGTVSSVQSAGLEPSSKRHEDPGTWSFGCHDNNLSNANCLRDLKINEDFAGRAGSVMTQGANALMAVLELSTACTRRLVGSHRFPCLINVMKRSQKPLLTMCKESTSTFFFFLSTSHSSGSALKPDEMSEGSLWRFSVEPHQHGTACITAQYYSTFHT